MRRTGLQAFGLDGHDVVPANDLALARETDLLVLT
jgi:hypothetical protein